MITLQGALALFIIFAVVLPVVRGDVPHDHEAEVPITIEME
jgi:hypothetical protein